MGFHVDMKEVFKALETLSTESSSINTQLTSAKTATNNIIGSGALYGQVGEVIYNQLNNYDAALQLGLADVMTIMPTEFAGVISDFQSTVSESNEAAILDEDTLTKLAGKIDTHKTKKTNLETSIKGIYNDISDLVSLKSLKSNFGDDADDAKKILTDAVDHVNSFEGAASESASGTLLDTYATVISGLSQIGSLAYTDPNYSGFMGNAQFATVVGDVHAEIKKQQEAIEKAQKEQERLAKEELKKKEEEWKKHHPVQNAIRNVVGGMNDLIEGASNLTPYEFINDNFILSDFEAGVLKGAVEMVGGVLELGANVVQLSMEAGDFLNGTASDWEKEDLIGTFESTKNLARLGLGANAYFSFLNPLSYIPAALDFMHDSGLSANIPVLDEVATEVSNDKEMATQAGKHIGNEIVNAFKKDPEEALGRAAFEIVTTIFVPETKAGTAAEAINLTSKVAKTADMASDASKVAKGADMAGDLGKVARGADELADLSRVAGFGDELVDASKLSALNRGVKAVAEAAKTVKTSIADEIAAITERVRNFEIPVPSPQLVTEAGAVGGMTTVRVGDLATDIGRGISRFTGGAGDDIASAVNKADDLGDVGKAGQVTQEATKADDALTVADDIIRDGSHFDEAGKLKPNIKYQTGEHNYLYQTDDLGRISRAHADDLQLKIHDGRLRHNAKTPGKIKGKDHAGHIFGDLFGGSPELDNLVSQAKDVNLKEYRRIERDWADALRADPPKKVEADIKINYDGISKRPKSFEVNYKIDGVKHFEEIPNINI